MSKSEMIAKLREKLSESDSECECKGKGCPECSDKESMEHEKGEEKSRGGMKDMLSKLKSSIVKVAAIKNKKA